MDVVGLQETLWFGTNSYQVDDCLVLASGRPTPSDGESARRGEGVAVVLRGRCRDAFVRGGSQWKGHSSRLVSARVKFECGRNRSPLCIQIAVGYAPTFARPRAEKTAFYNSLQTFIDSVPKSDQYCILGDFNARVGVGEVDDEWSDVRGQHGFGRMNSAGEELLNFLARNGAVVCNTLFKKKEIHKHTWFHPRYKHPHCIDYCIIPQAHRSQCLDCQVIRNAECDTDHKFLGMKYRLGALPSSHVSRNGVGRSKPIAVSRLRSGAPEDMEVARERFSKGMDAELEKVWTPNPSIEEWWSTLRTTTINVASDCLGRERRRQPEWFTDKRTEIESVLRDRDSCYSTWMSTRKASDLDLYKKSRSAARCTMRRLKRDWLLRQAKDCEWFGLTAKSGWECIGNIKTTLGGMRPRAATAIRNKQGEICDTAEATGGRWREHFDGLLNIASAYDLEVVDSIEQRPVMTELGVVPECDEIWRALRGMKCGKACGGSEISVEMLKYGGPTLIARLHELIRVVWETGSVPQDWSDAILVPIPKKGDLGSCDNWRGISLLDVAG
ncbi:uncharacterized protein LOC135823705 [Sycon ciliatum]|uniref:uncharacterized protein LOC135823705 n=1 Tax=Sycon ciliatum TaxID=27933 RepID=UPI0031F717CF